MNPTITRLVDETPTPHLPQLITHLNNQRISGKVRRQLQREVKQKQFASTVGDLSSVSAHKGLEQIILSALTKAKEDAYGRGVTAGKLEALKYTSEERERYGKWVAQSESPTKAKEQNEDTQLTEAHRVLGALSRALKHGALSMNPRTLEDDIHRTFAAIDSAMNKQEGK